MTVDQEFTQASHDFHEKADIAHRKALGQYMTPASISKYLVGALDIQPGERVLEPAVGTGELLVHALQSQPEAYYEGWDIDEEILSYGRRNLPDEKVPLHHRSTLDTDEPGQWDVILTNPPYYELKVDAEQKRRFAPVLGGRPNVFSLFFFQALSLLRPGGRLGFIVPPSMNNGAFFANLRKYIISQGTVKHLKVFTKSDMFHNAQTAVQVLVVEKKAEAVNQAALGNHVLALAGNHFFVQDAQRLLGFWDGKESLHDLGYKAITGSVVWNKFKDVLLPLSSIEAPGVTPLVYASDIKESESGVHVSWAGKHNHRRGVPTGMIRKDPVPEGIVVNRITGGLGSQSLRAAYIATPFYGENHVNVVVPRSDAPQQVGWTELLRRLADVDMGYVAEFTGNTQISSTELQHYLPL